VTGKGTNKSLICRGLAAAILLMFAGGAAAAKLPVPVKDRPGWVVSQLLEPDFTVPQDDISQGVYYLLVDIQVYAPQKPDVEYFYHYAQHIVNQTGVEQSAQIHIDYNPAYQSLKLHEVAVWRDGKKIDKLDTARANLINRERELDQLLYSGEKTLHLVLDDIRVGDTLEYSHTVKGYNPIYEGIFAYSHYTEWAVPVRQLSIIVHWLKPNKLYHKLTGEGFEVKTELPAEGIRYIVEKRDIKALVQDEDTPFWFDPFGVVRFSESPDWQSVADWARPLMESGVSKDARILEIASNIAKMTQDPAEQIAAALQYVQTQVRYFGIEIGGNSHRPSKAEDTLARRFGDCKDKTVLLLSILRALGIESYAALVSSQMHRELKNVPPAIHVFDHVIVSVLHDGAVYWLDPTRQYQAGGLNELHQPDYGYALVLNPGARGLTEATPQRQAALGSELHETFDLSGGMQAPVLYSAHTVVSGYNAEKLRGDLADSGQTNAQKDYLNFYTQYYPSLKTIEAARFTDHPALNRMEVNEKYSIGKMWEENSSDKKLYAWFHANSILPHLQKVKVEQRNHPLKLDHPVNIRHSIEVSLHDYHWKFEDEDFSEDNPFFSFSNRISFDEKTRKLLLEYSYTSKTDFILPEQIEDYIEAYDKVSEQSRYGIFINPAAQAGGTQAEPDYLLRGLGLYIFLYTLIFVAWRVQQERQPFTGEAAYYPVTLPKFIAMWACTFGLYGFYWFYRNWLYVKQRDHSSIMPLARSIFSFLWYYPLYADLRRDNAHRHPQRSELPPRLMGIPLALAFCAAIIIFAYSGHALIASLAAMLLALPLANYILFVNRAHPEGIRHYSKWRPRHFLLALLSTPLLLWTLGSETGLTPGDTVIRGKNLLSYNMKFLQRRGIVRPGDEIEYFYSDAFISIRDDGNGFSDRHVFSYWVDDNEFFLESATYDKIKDINVTWGGWSNNTVIEVTRSDDSHFTLYASASGKRDKLFVDSLLRRWKQKRSPTGNDPDGDQVTATGDNK
jgi:transglutaminase-like putative cysteine protease